MEANWFVVGDDSAVNWTHDCPQNQSGSSVHAVYKHISDMISIMYQMYETDAATRDPDAAIRLAEFLDRLSTYCGLPLKAVPTKNVKSEMTRVCIDQNMSATIPRARTR